MCFHKMTIESMNLDLEFVFGIVHHKAIGWKRTTINLKNQVDNPPKCEEKVKVNKGVSGRILIMQANMQAIRTAKKVVTMILILCGGSHVLSKESVNPPLLTLLSKVFFSTPS